MIVLLGNSSLHVAETAAKAYRDKLSSQMMVCGGKGHSTSFLYDNIRKNKKYQKLQTEDKSEGELFYEVLTKYEGVDRNALLLESFSTNCGSNAEEAKKLLESHDFHPRTILLLQDPILQRRSDASFQKVFQSENIRFISYASFIPLVKEQNGIVVYENNENEEFCSMDRLLSLVMGEIPRLLDNENGYGPNGKNYIVHVPIPQEVEIAFQNLKQTIKSDYMERTKL